MSKTYGPFRNGLFLSYATAIAYSLGADLIYYGAHADDAAGNAYPDCTPEFYEGMNEAINQGTGKKVKLYAPLLHLNKAEIVEAGIEIGAPYAMTWSCYEGRQLACGKCGTCVDRVAAFHANAATDPIPYEA
jgi:7-cyano-7-deazaguanine synthase